MNKRFGYVRVSSKDQNIARQKNTMIQLGIEERDIFVDKQSGKDFDRPQYNALKTVLRHGDTIVFDSITRMGRNMDQTLEEYRYFVDQGVNLEFVKEPMLNTDSNQDDVILKAIQNAVLAILAAFAEKERDDIKSRQAEGIAVAQSRGVKFGRPIKEIPEEFPVVYDRWKAGEIKAVEAMEMLRLKKTIFYRFVKQYEEREALLTK